MTLEMLRGCSASLANVPGQLSGKPDTLTESKAQGAVVAGSSERAKEEGQEEKEWQIAGQGLHYRRSCWQWWVAGKPWQEATTTT
jgi:hypothetical protein